MASERIKTLTGADYDLWAEIFEDLRDCGSIDNKWKRFIDNRLIEMNMTIDKWKRFIDNRLIEWGRDPTQIQDPGVDAPSSETIGQGEVPCSWPAREDER